MGFACRPAFDRAPEMRSGRKRAAPDPGEIAAVVELGCDRDVVVRAHAVLGADTGMRSHAPAPTDTGVRRQCAIDRFADDALVVASFEFDRGPADRIAGLRKDLGAAGFQEVRPTLRRRDHRRPARPLCMDERCGRSGVRERSQRIDRSAAPGDGKHVDVTLQRLVQRGTGGQIPGCILPQPHVESELELATHVRDERSCIGSQIDDAARRRYPCPEMKAGSGTECRIARRPLNPAVREQAIGLARVHMNAGPLPRWLLRRQGHQRHSTQPGLLSIAGQLVQPVLREIEEFTVHRPFQPFPKGVALSVSIATARAIHATDPRTHHAA